MSQDEATTTTTPKLPETLKEIEQEYQRGCLQAGNLQYQKVCIDLDLGILNNHLKALNNKAFLMRKAEAAKEAIAEVATPEVQL